MFKGKMRLENYAILVFLCCFTIHQIYGQRYTQFDRHKNITWCTISNAEQNKCTNFSVAVEREKAFFGENYFKVICKQAFSKEECMNWVESEDVALTSLDAGEVFVGGRYHSLIPIIQELDTSRTTYQYAVAVVRKGSLPDVQSLYDLKGKKACFAGVGTLAGWVLPINILMKYGGMEITDCNNHVKSTINFFGPSCAVNSLIDKYNPLGDNSDQLCRLCIGKMPGQKCTNRDPYAGYEGAFRCLVEAGDIAFLIHTTVQEMTSTTFDFTAVNKEQFELLCRDGSRRSVDEYRTCNWGTVPSRAIVTSSATNVEDRTKYQKFVLKAAQIFHKNKVGTTDYNRDNNRDYNRGRFNNPNEYNIDWNSNRNGYNRSFDNFGENNDTSNYNINNIPRNYNESVQVRPIEVFDLYESAPRYGKQHNLMFSDSTIDFEPLIETKQTYLSYLERSLDLILGIRHCPVNRMTLCVTSTPEMQKCIKMKIALKAQLLKPDLYCQRGHSHINCMKLINDGDADVAVLDASDVYTAGLEYNLIPFMSEVYNLDTPDYYVVAVAKEEDDNTDLTYLKNKNTCHPGINTAAGWIYPMAHLISNSLIRGYGCDSVRAAAEYFSKSCVPGALSTEYNIGVPYDNMCDLCHGVSHRYCRRDASEDYFGYTGAFRCLVEGGGDVAFVKHTTVAENTDGKRRDFWARNTFTKDFELLCMDGTRRPTSDYKNCNLGSVAANAIVTRGGYYGYNDTQINAYINLLIYAQQFYGRKEQDEFSFSMYYSPSPYSDLIFQDATQKLVIIPPQKREYSAYLGQDFMRARRVVDCHAGASAISYSVFATILMIIFTFAFSR